ATLLQLICIHSEIVRPQGKTAVISSSMALSPGRGA
ncbi:hypothetical protein SAMN05216197_1583, partial [Pseudomonas graminis]